MEEIKAKTFEEVSLAFNYPIDSVKNNNKTYIPKLRRVQGSRAESWESVKYFDHQIKPAVVIMCIHRSASPGMIWMILR